MSEILDLQKDLIKLNHWLEHKLEEQKPLVKTHAKAEHDYRVALASEITRLKLDGMSVTLIPDLAKGDRNVAKLRMERDIAKGVMFACKDAIESLRAEMSGLQTLLSTKKEEMKLL